MKARSQAGDLRTGAKDYRLPIQLPGVFLDHLPMLIFGRQGRIVAINDCAEIALGLPHGVTQGRTLFAVGCRILDDRGIRLPDSKQPWNQAHRTGKSVPDTIIGIRLPDGNYRWHQTLCIPISPDGGRRRSAQPWVAVVLTDMTRYCKTQHEVLQSQKMEAIGSLASGLAHDFNNIVTSIRTSAQYLLLDRDVASSDYEALKDIENESLRGAELSRQLLLVGKPASGKITTTPLDPRIRELTHLLRRTLPKAFKIRLRLDAPAQEVRVASTEFDQVLMNLTLNARDAMLDGGEIGISTSIVVWEKDIPCSIPSARSGSYARIEVTDCGSGIPPTLVPRIFEPYYTTKAEKGGTGLGLSIVYRIVRQYKGYITVLPVVPKGTNMTVYLPVARRRSPPRKTVTVPPTADRPRGGHECILVVDDERIITKSTARFLERYGYHTLTAADGKEALNCYKESGGDIDLVLLDMEMPELSGMECLARMLEFDPYVRVIAFSGHILKPQEMDPVKAGAATFVQKPYDSDQLLAVVRSVLDGGKCSKS